MIGLLVKGIWLDTREGEEKRFFLNKTLHDIRDMFGRNSDRSRSIVLPRTANNINILVTHSPQLGGDYRALSCQVYMSGVPVLEDASLVITSEDANHYECQIIGGAATFYSLLSDDSIKNLDFSADNFEWTLANYVLRNSRSSNLVTAWSQWITNESYQKYLDEGGVSTEEMNATDIDKAGFCYYTKDILAKIFDNTGLQIDTSQVTNEDYNTLAIICPMSQIFDSHDSSNSDRGLVGFIENQTVPTIQGDDWYKLPFDKVDINEGFIWDALNFWYVPNETMPLKLTSLIYIVNSIPGEHIDLRLRKFVGSSGQTITLQQGSIALESISREFNVSDTGSNLDRYWIEARPSVLGFSIRADGTKFEFRNQTPISRDIQISDWLPEISQRELVKNVFNLFHIVVSDISGRIVLSLFDEIESKNQVNLNDKIAKDRQIKFAPRLQNYAQENHFKYSDEPLVITKAFNEIIQISNNGLENSIIKIELFFGGSDGSLFSSPPFGRVVPSYHFDYRKEDNNKMHIIGGGVVFTTYNTQDANELADNDIVFIGSLRYVVRRVLDNKNGEFTHIGTINTNDLDWTFSHYIKNAHKFQLANLVFDDSTGVNTYIHYQGSERNQVGGIIYHTNLLYWDYLIENYYPVYKKMIQDLQVVNVWVDIPNTVFLELNSLAPIYVLGNKYYLNKTEQYKENGLVRLELIRFN